MTTMTMDKQLKPLVEAAEAQGWTVEPTSNGRFAFKSPDTSQKPVFIAKQLSNGRALKNYETQLRRAGLILGEEKPAPSEPALVEIESPFPGMRAFEASDIASAFEALGLGSPRDAQRNESEALDTFSRTVAAAGMALVQASHAGCTMRLRELGRERDEARTVADKATSRADKSDANASVLGKEVTRLTKENAALLERAVAAERSLKAIRDAIGVVAP